jgi:hypothetical protein
VLFAALVVRIPAFGHRLSADEGYTWLVASSHGLGTFLDRLAAFENTPPLYYLLAWPLPHASEAWLRLPSLLAGVGCVAALYWAVRPLAGTRAALLSAAALAVAPYAVSYSDFGRGFVLADLGLVVALAGAVRRRWWIYFAGGAIAVYSEYDSALFLIALAAAARVPWRRGLLPLLVLVPWIPEIARGADAVGHTKVSPVYPDPSLATLRDLVVRLTFGEHGTAHAAGLRWLQFLVVAAVLVWAFSRAPRLLWMTAVGTLLLHAIVHWIGPDVFAPRYLTELVPLGAAAVGIAVARAPVRTLAPAAAVAIAAVGIAVVVQRASHEYEPNVAGVVELVAPAARGRVVVTNSAVVAYYARRLHARLDRPFGLGPGLEAGCVHPCRASFLVIDDAAVAGGPRLGRGPAHAFGRVYVRASPKVEGARAVEEQGKMSSLACSLALLLATSFAGVGVPHPMEVTVQDDALLLHQQPYDVQRTARRLAALGADRVRITAGWSSLAPAPRSPKRPANFNASDPSQYQPVALRALDTAVKAASGAGLKVQLDLAFWAPRWAVARGVSQRDRQRWQPDSGQFGQFATAMARRYNGNYPDPTSRRHGALPAVRLWTPWNEPNHPTFLLPQSVRTRSGRWRDIAPHVYRAMYDAAYTSLKSVNPQNQVLIGGLSSRGATRPGPSSNIPPLRFLREMACLDDTLKPLADPACSDFHPLKADGFAYHPYSFDAPPDVPYGGPDTVHLADLSRLTELIAQLHQLGRITSDWPLYLTEFGYQTNPPRDGGIDPQVQARYMSESAFLAWANPDVDMFAQFLLQDVSGSHSYATGLLFPNGQAKPALEAFKLPFWAQAEQGTGQQPFVLAWGQVRPGAGSQKVEVQAQGADGVWRSMPSVARGDGRSCQPEKVQFLTDANGFYLRALPYQGVVAYRARWTRPDGGDDYSLPVTVGAPSAPVRTPAG